VPPHGAPPQNRILCALAHGTALEYVSLNAVRIDSSCAAAVVTMASAMRRLRSLTLEGNALSEIGLIILAQGLTGHPRLAELQLGDQRTPLTAKAVDALIEMMEQVRPRSVGTRGPARARRLRAACAPHTSPWPHPGCR
jgi:hypothetical protein